MPVYIKFYIFTYINIYIYIHIDTHSMLFSCLNSSMLPHLLQENIQVPEHKLAPAPMRFFPPSHSFPFFEHYTLALVRHLKWSHCNLASHEQHSFRDPILWQGQSGTETSVLLSPFSQSGNWGQREGCVVSGEARILLDFLFPTLNLPCL